MRVCVVAYKFYESSPRVMLFANALARRGDSVEIIALRRPGQQSSELIDGVHVYRVQERTRNEQKRWTYLIRMVMFCLRTAVSLTARHLKKRYDLVHVFGIPEFLVFAVAVPKFFGTPVLLDAFDLTPELYASKFSPDKISASFVALTWLERASIRFSDHVIAPCEVWKQRLISRSAPEGKCSVISYVPDPELFFPRQGPKVAGEFTILYPGTLNPHQGLDVAIRAFSHVVQEVPGAKLRIVGEGPSEPVLRKLIKDLTLDSKVTICGFVPAEQVPDLIASCNLGIVPKRISTHFGNEAPSTKILEFMAVGVPVVASRTAIEQTFFDESVVEFFTPEDDRELAACLLRVIHDEKRRTALVKNAAKFIAENGWATKRGDFFRIVDQLCRKRGTLGCFRERPLFRRRSHAPSKGGHGS